MQKFYFILGLLFLSFHISNAQLVSKKRPATENEIFQLSIQGIQEEDILWYISDQVDIKRQIDATNKTNIQQLQAKGKVSISAGKVYERALFTSNASATFESKTDEYIEVRFEHGDGRTLKFSLSEEINGDRYYNLIYEKDPETNKKYIIYAGDKWELISGSNCRLEYKAKGSFKNKTNKTKIRGLNKDGTERKGILDKIKKGN